MRWHGGQEPEGVALVTSVIDDRKKNRRIIGWWANTMIDCGGGMMDSVGEMPAIELIRDCLNRDN